MADENRDPLDELIANVLGAATAVDGFRELAVGIAAFYLGLLDGGLRPEDAIEVTGRLLTAILAGVPREE